MKVLVTGSAGRVGRAIYIKLMKQHQVVGLDLTPCSTVDFVGDLSDNALIERALEGVDTIVHTAALHAPHVGLAEDDEFERVNVKASVQIALQGIKQGVKHIVYTSTTALYGAASTPPDKAGWIDEAVTPEPKTVYHRSKLAAENQLADIATLFNIPLTILRMSRCFPEPVDLMTAYRLTRGIDARDVASAHALAVAQRLSGVRRYIISGATPFRQSDCAALLRQAPKIIIERAPSLAAAFEQRHWPLPHSLDRVYDSALAQKELGWQPIHGFASVLALFDDELAEVLPVTSGKLT